jgi:hypothetical protein
MFPQLMCCFSAAEPASRISSTTSLREWPRGCLKLNVPLNKSSRLDTFKVPAYYYRLLGKHLTTSSITLSGTALFSFKYINGLGTWGAIAPDVSLRHQDQHEAAIPAWYGDCPLHPLSEYLIARVHGSRTFDYDHAGPL